MARSNQMVQLLTWHVQEHGRISNAKPLQDHGIGVPPMGRRLSIEHRMQHILDSQQLNTTPIGGPEFVMIHPGQPSHIGERWKFSNIARMGHHRGPFR